MLSSICRCCVRHGENLPESADMLDFAEMLTGARGKVPRVSQLEAWLEGVAEVYDLVSDQI